jgi:hypothetical protein
MGNLNFAEKSSDDNSIMLLLHMGKKINQSINTESEEKRKKYQGSCENY